MELKTSRFSTAIGSKLYAEDRVEYFSVVVVVVVVVIIIIIIIIILTSVGVPEGG